ncbi:MULTISPECIES: hypothetical protein [Halomonadaceae]|jgi:hypothetical protein|uniref:Uncharacterized protein n=4 Tax=Vreelandella TaxID=3137766 RepID=A0A7Z0LRS0_9GAMM|nr:MULTISPECIES: hypothetical protein [Halomonas]NAO94685.1 hypothetical protein [Halomonas sp. MG34]QGQ71715.1 hypothetical protein FDY98_19565 [Halomonas sp. PA16-9]TDV97837.1 hypothetical protein BDK62_105184 [Halomonas alkaliantarctica]UEQ03661.1 hypothetical protein LMS44_20660 [Halomonas profundus]MBF56402.1 hypothetical protein [Halomonas sp.]|tara:strand:- start:592 stop:780 length:189 start_codon:yes stop_codon:yes gene_type:complete
MKRSKWIWLVWAVVLLSYLVPYTLLSGVALWYGSFLFWMLAGLAIIALNVFITKDFEEHSND